jgi:hypothetical protein
MILFDLIYFIFGWLKVASADSRSYFMPIIDTIEPKKDITIKHITIDRQPLRTTLTSGKISSELLQGYNCSIFVIISLVEFVLMENIHNFFGNLNKNEKNHD